MYTVYIDNTYSLSTTPVTPIPVHKALSYVDDNLFCFLMH